MMQWPARRPWYQSCFVLNLAGGLILWTAFPPLGWWPLAWIAPWCWFIVIDRQLQQAPTDNDPAASGERRRLRDHFDGSAWLPSCLCWLLLLQGLRLAHWGTHFGWIALAMYLAVYLPVFLTLTSRLTQRTPLPLPLAAAISWTILEWIRGHLITGFSFCLLAHTQAQHLWLIQVADFSGAYGVSFLVMLVSGLIYRAGPWNPQRSQSWSLAPALTALLLLALTAGYGALCLRKAPLKSSSQTFNVGLVQGSIDTQFGEAAIPDHKIFKLYNDLTLQLRLDNPDLDLVVWPESMFSYQGPELLMDQDSVPPKESTMDPVEFQERAKNHNQHFYQHTVNFAQAINRLPTDQGTQDLEIAFILGTNCWQLPPQEKRFNSAILVSPQGNVTNRYHKMHRVMFGEFVPGGHWFPWLYQLTPMGSGLTAGEQPVSFKVKNWTLVPNICFESSVPHLIRRQVQHLRSAGHHPDALITITNDGWFWGSTILDLHLLCGVFRAVENRLPLLIAANTGISAWIDEDGRLMETGPRRRPQNRENGVIVAHLKKSDPRTSWYQRWGDWPWILLGLGTLMAAYWPLKGGPRTRKKEGLVGKNGLNDCDGKLW